MNNKELEEFVELLIPYIKKKLKNDKDFRMNVKRKNAIVESVNKDSDGSTVNQNIGVKFPYDTAIFTVPNKTGEELLKGDLICIEYSIDIKNAIAVYKVN